MSEIKILSWVLGLAVAVLVVLSLWGPKSEPSSTKKEEGSGYSVPTIPAKEVFKPVQTSKVITLRPGEKYTWARKNNYKKYVWQNADGFPTNDGSIVEFSVYSADRDCVENITNVTQTGTIAIYGD